MNTPINPLTLMDEIHERLDLLREYFIGRTDASPVPPCNTKEKKNLAAIRDCIRQLMDMKTTDRNGRVRPLFHSACHWQAIYRILVDYNLGATDGDYFGFKTLAERITPKDCRVPFNYEALRGISKTAFVRPFVKWSYDSTYFKTRQPYDTMYGIAHAFLVLLREKGLVKS
jgi:hypothetical protein